MKPFRAGLVAGVVLVALLLTGCGKADDDPASGEKQEVSMQAYDYYFEPTSITVNVGAEVTLSFKNNGAVTHSFTAPDLDVETVADSSNSSTVTFTAPAAPGSFDFFCKYHPDQMKGTISVGGADQPVENQPDVTDDESTDSDY
ncbi:MAG TPA: cupredoxin domain-containing protein [Actinomycetota bacterium]|nr:cupredoxin domain-containing protein [Actinomycetota bacterium]